MLLIGGIAGIALNGEVVARRHQNEGGFDTLIYDVSKEACRMSL